MLCVTPRWIARRCWSDSLSIVLLPLAMRRFLLRPRKLLTEARLLRRNSVRNDGALSRDGKSWRCEGLPVVRVPAVLYLLADVPSLGATALPMPWKAAPISTAAIGYLDAAFNLWPSTDPRISGDSPQICSRLGI